MNAELSHQVFVSLKTLTLKKAYEHNNPLRMKENNSIFRMIITLMKASDEFEDGPSVTTKRGLKTHTCTSKKLVNTITLMMKVKIANSGM